jgi:Ca2+:H+ antiporter
LAGGLKHRTQKFNRTAATMSATLMALSAIGLLMPALFHWVTRGTASLAEKNISLEISIVLFVTYVLSLIFALGTHKDLYLGTSQPHEETSSMRPKTAGLVLLGATVLIAWMSELLVHAVEPASKSLGLTQIFVGVIAVAIIGNAAEHSTAIMMAMKESDRPGLSHRGRLEHANRAVRRAGACVRELRHRHSDGFAVHDI